VDREKARALVESIVRANVEMHGVKIGPEAAQALAEAVGDLHGLIDEIYDECERPADADTTGVRG